MQVACLFYGYTTAGYFCFLFFICVCIYLCVSHLFLYSFIHLFLSFFISISICLFISLFFISAFTHSFRNLLIDFFLNLLISWLHSFISCLIYRWWFMMINLAVLSRESTQRSTTAGSAPCGANRAQGNSLMTFDCAALWGRNISRFQLNLRKVRVFAHSL